MSKELPGVLSLVAIAFLLAGVTNVRAANAIKLDTTAMLTNSVNWSGGSGAGATVASTDIGEFNSTPSASTLANLTVGSGVTLSFAGLLFDNNLNGPVTMASGGTLNVGASGIDMSLANQNVTVNSGIGVTASFAVNVGSGRTLTLPSIGTASGKVVTKSGSGTLSLIGNADFRSSGGGEGFLVTGGSVSATGVVIGRNTYPSSVSSIGVPSSAASTTTGFYVSGSGTVVNFTGSSTISYIGVQNSGATARIDDGTVTMAGPLVLGRTTNSRYSVFQVNGGSFTSADTGTGLQIAVNSGTTANYADLYLTGGTTTFEKIQFGASTDTVGGSGYLTLAGGTLYLGSSGIVKSTPQAGYNANICLNSGVLGAKANWNTSLPVSLNGTVTIQAANSSATAYDITLSGNITTTSGTGIINKTGAGTLTLSGENTYSGGTTNTAGQLKINNGGSSSASSAIGTGPLTITGGTLDNTSAGDVTLLPNNLQNWNGDFSYVGSVHNLNLGTGNVAMNASRQVTVTANTLTVGGVISGSGYSLTKAGAGTLTLSGANTYSGGTTVNNGTLALSGSGTLGNSASPVAVSGGTLDLGALSVTVGAVTNSGGTIQNGTLTGTSYVANNAGAAAISANLAGSSVALSMSGAGTLTLSGANTYSGGTTISAGTLLVGNAQALGTGAGSLAVNGGVVDLNGYSIAVGPLSGTSGVISNSGSSSALTAGDATSTTYASVLGDAGVGKTLSLTKTGTGALTLTAANTYTGTSTLNAGTLVYSNSAALGTGGNITFAGGALKYGTGFTDDLSARIKNSTSAISVDDNGQVVSFNSALDSSNLGGLTKTGAGTLTLAGANAYGGNTTNSAGTLVLGSTIALGAGTLVMNGGNLDSSVADLVNANNNAQSWNSDIIFTGSQNLDLGTGAVTPSASRTVTVTANNLTVGGVIGGAYGLTKSGSGTLTLSGANTYSGGTTNSAGTLKLGNINALQNSTLRMNGGSLSFGSLTSATFGGLSAGSSGAGYDIALQNDSSTAVALTVGGNNASPTYVAVLSGVGSLTKTGTGTLTLSATNSYSGTTTIGAGVLSIGGAGQLGGGDYSGNISNSGNLKYASSAPQTLSGVISGTGSLTNSGAGILTLSGANNYSGTSTLGAGTLVFNNATALGASGDITFAGGTLQYGSGITADLSARIKNSASTMKIDDNGQSVTFTSAVVDNSNTAGLNKYGSGTLTLGSGASGGASYTGGTTIYEGTLVFGGVGNMTISSQIGISGYSGASNLRIADSAVVTSSGLMKLCYGTSYPSVCTVTVQDNASVSLGSFSFGDASGRLPNGCAVTVQDAAALTVSGTFDLNKTVNGTTQASDDQLNLNGGVLTVGNFIATYGSSTHKSTIHFNGGVLKANGNSVSFLPALGGLTSKVDGNGAIIHDNGYSITIGSALIHGAGTPDGGLTKLGSGTLTLSNTNTYTGATTISNGTVALSCPWAISNSPSIAIVAGATCDVSAVSGGYTIGAAQILKGNGTVKGALTVLGTNAPGFSPGTITIDGDYTQSGTLLIEIASTTSYDKVVVNGNATLGGTLTVTNLVADHALLPGNTYTVMTANAISGSFAVTNVQPALTGGRTLNINNTGTALVLSVGEVTAAGTYWWDVNETADGIGGAGTWDASMVNWRSPSTNSPLTIYPNVISNGDTAVFAGTAGTVTHNGTLNVGSLVFGIDGYTLSGGTFDLSGALGAGLVASNGVSATISSILTGANSLTKSGPGTVTLSGANTYSGDTTNSVGTLTLGSTTALGTGTLVMNGGNLDSSVADLTNANNNAQNWSGNFTFVGSQNLHLGTGAVTLGANRQVAVTAGTLTVGGNISGSSYSLTKSGSGTLTLAGTGTSSLAALYVTNGLLNITAGRINVVLTSSIGAPALNNGGNVTISDGALTITSGSNQGWFPIGDTPSQTSTLTLNGGSVYVNNSYGTEVARQGYGVLTINGGSFTNADKNGSGFIIGDQATAQGGTVNLNGGSLVVNKIVSSAGANYFYFNGGVLSPTAANSSFWANSAKLTAAVKEGGGTINNAGVAITIAQPVLHGGDAATDGGLTFLGSGTTTMSGANSYSGNTTISAGILDIKNNSALGSGSASVSSGAVLQVDGSGLIVANALTLNGTGLSNGGALRNLANNNEYSGAITLAGDTRINSDGGILSLTSGTAITSGCNLTFGGAGNVSISTPIQTGAYSLTKDGNGTLTLSGVNTYSGQTTVSAGTLKLNTAPTATSGYVVNGTMDVTPLGTLTLSSAQVLSGVGTVNGAVATGSGAILAPGTGTATTGGAGTNTVSDLTLAAGTVINYGLNAANTNANLISVTNALTFPASGTVTLNLYEPGSSTPFAAPGKYNLFRYTSIVNGSDPASKFTIATSIEGFVASFSTAAGPNGTTYLVLTLTTIGPRTWTGGSDSTWDGNNNWDPAVSPAPSDAVIFSNSAAVVNNRTTIDLGVGASIANITFDTVDAAPYTIGEGGVGAQTLTLYRTAAVTMNSTVVTDQLFNANILLGTDGTAQTITLANSSSGQSLTFAGALQGGTGGTAGIKTVNSTGAGAVTFQGTVNKGGGSAINLGNTSTGNLTLSGSGTSALGTLRATGNGTVTVNGQSVTVASSSLYGASSAYGKLVLQAGSAAFNGGIQSATSSGALAGGDGMAFIVNGGNFSASYVSLGRSRNMGTSFFTTAQSLSSDGFQVNGGAATVSGTVDISGSNSSADGQVSGSGSLTIGGQLIIGEKGGGRINLFQVTGGTLTVNDATSGISIMKGTTADAGKGQLLLTGGTTTTEKITFGINGGLAGSSGNLTLNGASAELDVGSGGIVLAASNPYTYLIDLRSGTVGAKANWSSALDMGLNGSAVTFKAADASDVRHDIALSGVLSGSGGITKTGAGALVLSGINTYTGATAVNNGTLQLNSSIASATQVKTNAVLAVSGSVSISNSVIVQAGGTISLTNAAAGTLTVTGGLTVTNAVVNLDLATPAASDMIALVNSALNGVGTTAINVTTNAGFASGTYDVITGISGSVPVSSFTVGPMPTYYLASLKDSGDGKLQLVVRDLTGSVYKMR